MRWSCGRGSARSRQWRRSFTCVAVRAGVGSFDIPAINGASPQTMGYDLVGLFLACHAVPEKGDPSLRHTQRKALTEYVGEL